jgi:hypothetical protein
LLLHALGPLSLATAANVQSFLAVAAKQVPVIDLITFAPQYLGQARMPNRRRILAGSFSRSRSTGLSWRTTSWRKVIRQHPITRRAMSRMRSISDLFGRAGGSLKPDWHQGAMIVRSDN